MARDGKIFKVVKCQFRFKEPECTIYSEWGVPWNGRPSRRIELSNSENRLVDRRSARSHITKSDEIVVREG